MSTILPSSDIPLLFVIPMWFQFVVLGAPRTGLALDPLVWFGLDGAFWLTLLLGFISFVVAYVYILKMKPGVAAVAVDEPVEEVVEDEPSDEDDEEVEEEEVEEEVEEEEVVVEEAEEEDKD